MRELRVCACVCERETKWGRAPRRDETQRANNPLQQRGAGAQAEALTGFCVCARATRAFSFERFVPSRPVPSRSPHYYASGTRRGAHASTSHISITLAFSTGFPLGLLLLRGTDEQREKGQNGPLRSAPLPLPLLRCFVVAAL